MEQRSTPKSPAPSVLRQALDWVGFSLVFALVFNAFYPAGIELKVKPKAVVAIRSVADAAPPTYAGWNTRPPNEPPQKAKPTPTAPSGFTPIGLLGAKRIFDAKSEGFIDARKPEDYAQGHIPGAVNFFADDFDRLAPEVLPTLDPAKPYVLYCTGSECDLSHELAKKLGQQGFKRLKVFFGGWPEWSKAGYPVVKGTQP